LDQFYVASLGMKCNINVLGDNFYGVTVLDVVIALKHKFTYDRILFVCEFHTLNFVDWILSYPTNWLSLQPYGTICWSSQYIFHVLNCSQICTDGKMYYVIFKLGTKFLYQKLCLGNRFANIFHIDDLHKFSNYQKYFHVINIDYVHLISQEKSQHMYCHWFQISNILAEFCLCLQMYLVMPVLTNTQPLISTIMAEICLN
jgi:hypothetical protein